MTHEAWPSATTFVETPLRVGAACGLHALAHQLTAVLRLAPGDAVTFVNGDGCEYLSA